MERRGEQISLTDCCMISVTQIPALHIWVVEVIFLPFRVRHKTGFFSGQVNPQFLMNAKFAVVMSQPFYAQSVNFHRAKSPAPYVEKNVRGHGDCAAHIHESQRFSAIADENRIRSTVNIFNHNLPFVTDDGFRSYYFLLQGCGGNHRFYCRAGRIYSPDTAVE